MSHGISGFAGDFSGTGANSGDFLLGSRIFGRAAFCLTGVTADAKRARTSTSC
jgi:hypothetical protein